MIIKNIPQFFFSNEEVAAAERVKKITEYICDNSACNTCPFNRNRGEGSVNCKITIDTIVSFFQDNKEH